jgi:hypothetical protein
MYDKVDITQIGNVLSKRVIHYFYGVVNKCE